MTNNLTVQLLIRGPFEAVLHFECGELRFDLKQCIAAVANHVIRLHKTEFHLLKTLDLGKLEAPTGRTWDLDLRGPIQESRTFAYYLTGFHRFNLEELHRTDIAEAALTPRQSASLYRAIAKVCDDYNTLPEDVMQSPEYSGDLVHHLIDKGAYTEEVAKQILQIAGYSYT